MDKPRGFRLHPINLIFVLMAFGAGGLNMLTNDATGDGSPAYRLGLVFGYALAICLFAGVFSLFVWLVSRRNSVAANVLFAGIVLLVSLATGVRAIVSLQNDRDLEDYAAVLRDNVDKSAEELQAASDAAMSDMIENSSGDEQQSYIATQRYMNTLLEARTEWETAYDAFMDDRVLDYSLLTSEEEFAYQKSAIEAFADSSGSYAEMYESANDLMRKALEETDMNTQAIEEFMAGFAESSRENNAVTSKFLRAHQSAANEYYKLLELLELEAWELDADTGELLFETDEAIVAFEAIINEALAWETQVEELSAEVERRRQAAAQNAQR